MSVVSTRRPGIGKTGHSIRGAAAADLSIFVALHGGDAIKFPSVRQPRSRLLSKTRYDESIFAYL